MKILWIEDERRIVEEGTLYLGHEGCKATHAYSAEQAVILLGKETFDLLLIDWKLPGKQGIDLIKEVQRKWNIPMIMVTSKTDELDKVIALEIGADDYITKPFGMRELLARMKAVLRRTSTLTLTGEVSKGSQIIEVGGLVIDSLRHEVRKNGQQLVLTPTEFILLYTLAEQPGRVFSRLYLLEQALGDAYAGFERTIDSHIRNLRRKVEDDTLDPKFIVTVYGIGYKFGEDGVVRGNA